MDIQSLPTHLQSIANNVLAHIHEGSSAPENINELTTWFEDDGWDEIVGAWSDERVVLKLYEIATRFDDREFRAWEDIEGAITDEARVAFARRQIDFELEAMSESFCPSVHSLELNDNGGKTAVLGWLVEISVGGHLQIFAECMLTANSSIKPYEKADIFFTMRKSLFPTMKS